MLLMHTVTINLFMVHFVIKKKNHISLKLSKTIEKIKEIVTA